MLICTNCLAEQSDTHTTVCNVCRMPFRNKAQDNHRVTVLVTQPVARQPLAVLCKNCAAELPGGKISNCPNCQIPVPVAKVELVQRTGTRNSLGEAKTDSGIPEVRTKQHPQNY